MAWEFGDNNPLRVRQWSELVIRDAEKLQVFAPLMYSLEENSRVKAADASKLAGVIQVHEDFKAAAGDRVTIANTARVTGKGIHGDALLRDTGENLATNSMDIYIEPVAMQLRTSGPLSEQRVLLNYRKEFRMKLAQWAARKIEEGIILTLSGLTSSTAASQPLDCWDVSPIQTSVFQNPVQSFDDAHIVYAGDATSAATIGSDDVMTAQLLTKLQTKAQEELDIPLEPLRIDGEDAFILMCSHQGVEQLLYDPDFVQAQRANTYNKQNPLLTGVVGKYGMFYIRPYPKMLKPATNVSRALVLGQNAMHLAKKDDWTWWEGYEDNAERRKVMCISAFLGMQATKFNGSRRNALAVEHYVR
jgi:N4-gp56 family major capsid protein